MTAQQHGISQAIPPVLFGKLISVVVSDARGVAGLPSEQKRQGVGKGCAEIQARSCGGWIALSALGRVAAGTWGVAPCWYGVAPLALKTSGAADLITHSHTPDGRRDLTRF